MSVKDLMKGMFFWETFVHDVEEFPSQVGFDSRIPRSVVPCDVAGSLTVLCVCAVLRWIVGEFKVVSAFVWCFLIRRNGFVENLLGG